MLVGNLITKLTLDAKGFSAGIGKATKQVKTLNDSVMAAGRGIVSYTGALTAVAAATIFAVKQFSDMAIEMQAINRRMEFVTGGGRNLERAWTFLRKTADSLSLSLEDLTTSYSNLAAATKDTGLSTKEVESIFLALSEASSVYGLSSERARLAFMAVEQMASKGVISMEELRRQLGDQLPGALNVMARALGVSTAELNKLVASGQLMSKDVLPLFALQLRRDMVEPVSKLGHGTRSAVAMMKTAWFDLKQTLSKEGTALESSIKAIISPLVLLIETVNLTVKAFNKLGEAMMSVDQASGLALKGVADMPKPIENVSNEVQETIKEMDTALKEGQKAFWASFGTSSADALDKWRKEVNASFTGVTHELTSLIVGMAMGADVSFRSMLDNMARKILEFTTHMLVIRPILEWFSTWLQGVTAPGGAGGVGILGSIFSALGAKVPVKAMADGGMISEPVAGIGLRSQTPYLMGEKGPEVVVPEDQAGSSQTNVSVNIQAVDSKSVTDLMSRNPQAIIGPLVKAINSGDRGLSTSMRLAVS